MPKSLAELGLSPTGPYNFCTESNSAPEILQYIVDNGPNLYKLTITEGAPLPITSIEVVNEVPDEAVTDGWHDRCMIPSVDGVSHLYMYFCP